MAISTFAELKTAIADWLDRSDITDGVLEEIISNTESRIASKIKFRAMETALSETLTATEQDVDYPSDALELKGALYIIEDDDRTPLTQVSEEVLQMSLSTLDSDTTGKPRYFYITAADKIFFDIIADEDYGIKGTYYKQLTLSDSATTNWLLTNYPMLYLYGCMFESKIRTDDDPRRYELMFDEQLQRLRKYENRTFAASGAHRVRQHSLDGSVGIFRRGF